MPAAARVKQPDRSSRDSRRGPAGYRTETKSHEYLVLITAVMGDCFWNIQAMCALKKPSPARPKLHFPLAARSSAIANSRKDISCAV
ncbi:hypothetical protein E2C01_076280 [Portunus trituberculatus]|uniref:Uncharacterized protein n=1 Tax=Portunus trituberculatus TaxID=210409 RepID=A0A5B7ICV4_PORTR|nr:hypothetical protein [Portunus trituberculatus]